MFFATNLNECKILTESQSLKIGQVMKLSATNFIVEQNSATQYFEYYKDIHKISYEITEGQNYAKVVDSYLYVNRDAPSGAKLLFEQNAEKVLHRANIFIPKRSLSCSMLLKLS